MKTSKTSLSRLALTAACLLALSACGTDDADQAPPPEQAPAPETAPPPVQAPEAPAEVPADEPVDAFLAAIAQHCGNAYAGEIEANQPAQPGDAFEGQTLVMHVRQCDDDQISIPFHVGDDHSRTWVLTRTSEGLRLKHDHRHEDGSDDAVTMYGGDTAEPGTAQRQAFPVDQESIELFQREGLDVSVTNVWAMEIEPGQTFVYELARTDSDRLFRVRFDLTETVETPPTPWGHE